MIKTEGKKATKLLKETAYNSIIYFTNDGRGNHQSHFYKSIRLIRIYFQGLVR